MTIIRHFQIKTKRQFKLGYQRIPDSFGPAIYLVFIGPFEILWW